MECCMCGLCQIHASKADLLYPLLADVPFFCSAPAFCHGLANLSTWVMLFCKKAETCFLTCEKWLICETLLWCEQLCDCRCWQTGSLWTARRCARRPKLVSSPSSPLAGSATSCAKAISESCTMHTQTLEWRTICLKTLMIVIILPYRRAWSWTGQVTL